MEETLSGEGTSRSVNGIALQARHFGPDLPHVDVAPIMSTSKKRSVVVLDKELPIYNAGQRCGPPSRAYVEVTIPGWIGFNIKVRNGEQVSQDNIGYLQTKDAPASNISTVFEVLSQSLKIKDSLRLNAIVVVFDQAIYAKAMEIKWKHSEHFRDIIVRMRAFHTICTLLGIIEKRLQDAFERPVCRVPSDCRRVSVGSDGRTEIQPCRAAAQACVRGPDGKGVVWIPKVGSREAR